MAEAIAALTFICCGALAVSCGGSPTAAAQTLTVTPLASFSSASHVFESETLDVLRDQTTWQTLWAQMNANDSPPRPLPPVDFSKDMVVVAAVGAQATGGSRVSVDSASESLGVVTVEVTVITPGPHCGLPTVITSPVAAATLPMRTGPVTFHVNRRTVDCGS